MNKPGNRKLVIIQVAALGYDFLHKNKGSNWLGLNFQPVNSVFPAVTCPVQASFRTASYPSDHGMISNGLFKRDLMRPLFWEQSASLVSGPRIWDDFRKGGKKVAVLFWQQSMGEQADYILSPAPIHKHHGGMIQDCYSKPAYMYHALCESIGRPFNLAHYWGPLASSKSSKWISDATCEFLSNGKTQADLCFTYLPVLDYDLQRYGPDHEKSVKALADLEEQLQDICDTANAQGYEILIFGDYAVESCPRGAVFPNQKLLDAGLLNVRNIRGMLYPDLHESRAFAMVDHEVAHVFVKNAGDKSKVISSLESIDGIDQVMTKTQITNENIAHPNSGELLLTASDGYWFSYQWWSTKHQAPDYAGHVDIHNKPGYDPCELFFGWPPGSVSQNTARIRGSHGKTSKGRETCWASTCVGAQPASLVDLAISVRTWLGES